jgi:hypothetical protein
VVKMTDDTLAAPYRVAPGTRVRVESAYDGNTRRLGAAPRRRPTRALLSARAPLELVRAGWMYAGSMSFNKHAPRVWGWGAYEIRGGEASHMVKGCDAARRRHGPHEHLGGRPRRALPPPVRLRHGGRRAGQL